MNFASIMIAIVSFVLAGCTIAASGPKLALPESGPGSYILTEAELHRNLDNQVRGAMYCFEYSLPHDGATHSICGSTLELCEEDGRSYSKALRKPLICAYVPATCAEVSIGVGRVCKTSVDECEAMDDGRDGPPFCSPAPLTSPPGDWHPEQAPIRFMNPETESWAQ